MLLQVELPLGATEDRICGSINIEQALQEGTKAFEPGLLVGPCCCSCKSACLKAHITLCCILVDSALMNWAVISS